ncbi:MAG TPA: DMT family transporter [Lacunisphaera sp.]
MSFSVHLLIPLACAFTYVVSAMMFKRAADLGVGVWRTTFVANWTVCLAFLPFWFVAGRPVVAPGLYWQPAVVASLFLLGQASIFLALKRGDVTVTTPVMGSKVIMVALFTTLLKAGDMPLRWWIGAGLSAAAVLLLHLGKSSGVRGRIGSTVFLAWLSATSYGLSDVLLQKWVPAWGFAAFAPVMFALVGLYSLVLIPFFSAPLRAMSAQAWRWVGGGSVLMALNNAGIVLAIGRWGGATAVNIVYSARGLVSIGAVWAVGHWFHSQEQHLEPSVLRLRLLGAALMLAAIVLVLA